MSKILFLDLDGTVRQTKSRAVFINAPYDQELMPGVVEAIAKYSDWTIVGVTNQAGVEAHKKTLDDCIKEQIYTMQLLPRLQCVNFCTTFNGSDGYRCYPNGEIINLPPHQEETIVSLHLVCLCSLYKITIHCHWKTF